MSKLIALVLGAVLVAAAPAGAQTTKPVTRLAGDDRIGTAIAISQNQFPTNGSADAVILTSSQDFPDAMSASPLAKQINAPIELTTPGELDQATFAEIQRVLPPPSSGTAGIPSTTCPTTPAADTVYIVGGYQALAQAIDAQLDAAGYNTVRVFGVDRFQTAVAVAKCEGSPGTVFLATGDIFADALSAGPAAGNARAAILLTDGDQMPSEVTTYLAGFASPTVYAIGAAAAQADPSATAIFGGDRYATSALVAEKFFPSPAVVGVATGADFPDALAGGAAMGLKGGPVILSQPDQLPSAEALYLTNNQASIQQAFLFGGTSALSPQVEQTVSNQINNTP